MDNHTQARFNDLIKSCKGLTPDSTAEDVYNAFDKIVSQNNPKRGKIGRTIMQQRNELHSITKDWKRDLTELIQRNEKAIEAMTPESKGIFRLQYEGYQFFSNPYHRLRDFRLKDYSTVFFDALHYDRTMDGKLIEDDKLIDFLRTVGGLETPNDSNRNNISTKLSTEDYFKLFIITIFQMGDLYYNLQKLKEELKGIDKGNSKPNQSPAYTSLKEIFVSNDAYIGIMKQLSDNDLTDKDTGLWIDKANGYKGRIVALLNDLFYKGYYNTTQMPMPETLMSIANNTFGVEISKRMFHSETIPETRKTHFYFIKKYILSK